jgi:type IV pilus assembly protein PilO
MNLNDEQKKVLAMIVLFGVLAVGGVAYYWFMFGKASVLESNDRAETAKAETQSYQDKLGDIEDFKQRTEGKYDELQDSIAQLEKRLPTTREAIGFFAALDTILTNTGVTNLRLAADKINEQTRYTEIPYSIKAEGRFHEYGQFLNLVEDNPERFMRVKTMKVGNNAGKPAMHPISVSIATFKFVQR